MDDDLGTRLIDAVHAVAGAHQGHRALHARGVGVTGRFTGSGDVAELTTAAHLQPGVVSAVDARFSNGSGDPHQPDGIRDGRGFAVKFRLADGTSTDLVGLTLPVFFVRTPDDFLAFLAARTPDPATGQPDLDRVLAFLDAHPEAQTAVGLSLSAPIPASYATNRYFGVHAFWFVAPDGTRRPIRYHWEPEAAPEVLTDEQAAAAAPDHLHAELRRRLGTAPAAFTLQVTLGADTDDVLDPTTAWPEDRPRRTAGRLELTEVPDDQAGIDRLIFDPTRLTPGIEASDDAILHARSAAYGVSYAQRTT